ncbi:MAG: holo-ACP synthase [Halanaerobiales bacterium]|nr:holo-ACP synthase [Halanaerobiales bacterium]
MIKGLGIDLVKIERFKNIIERWGNKFLERVFTPAELDYCRDSINYPERLAARFAAKEAAFKMLEGTARGVGWHDFEVNNTAKGRPQLFLRGKAARLAEEKGIVFIHLSLSHERDFAIAQVIGEG